MADRSRRRTTARTSRTQLVDGVTDGSSRISSSTSSTSIASSTDTTTTITISATTPIMGKKSQRSKEKEKKLKRPSCSGGPIKERWLLTRKTWKYMADAGRKLIPDGVTNRPEDLPKIEEYFQQVCRSEPKFLPWRRKASYPGALTSLRRKRRTKASTSSSAPTSPPKASSADEAEDDSRDDSQRLLVMIRMLEKYLNIKDNGSGDVVSGSGDGTAVIGDGNAEAIDADEETSGGFSLRRSEASQRIGGAHVTGGPFNAAAFQRVDSRFSDIHEDDNAESFQRAVSNANGSSAGGRGGSVEVGSSRGKARDSYITSSSNTGNVGSAAFGAVDRSTSSTTPLTYTSAMTRSTEQLKQNWLAQPYESATPRTNSGFGQNSSGIVSPPQAPSILRHATQTKRDTATNTPTSATAENTKRNSSSAWTAANMHTSLLLESLKNYSRTNRNPLLSYDAITSDILQDKRLLRQIRDELKQQQLQKLLRRHSSRSSMNLFGGSGSSVTPSTSFGSSNIFNFWQRDARDEQRSQIVQLTTYEPPASTVNTMSVGAVTSTVSASTPTAPPRRTYRSFGIQTDPIAITSLQALHADYVKRKTAADDDARDSNSGGERSPGGKHSKRKNSIDNEDVSQSVSDTIKRYLRMARKKSVTGDSDANRFKRVNYDKHLRNIKPKGEITLPGDDDGCMKGCQTDAEWICIVMGEIKAMGREIYSSPDSTDAEDAVGTVRAQQKPNIDGSGGGAGAAVHIHSIMTRRQQHRHPQQRTRFDYNTPVGGKSSTSTSPTHSSPPSPSPSSGGLFHSAQTPPPTTPATSTAPTTPTSASANMQKSKSSSNVGQVFSKKIWKSRSKSQTRTASPTAGGSGAGVMVTMGNSSGNTPDEDKKNSETLWSPLGNCQWVSLKGNLITLTGSHLLELSNSERKALYRVAVDRIGQLNIGVTVSAPLEAAEAVAAAAAAAAALAPVKKRRAPLLLKRKALTTSFFDSTKNKDDAKVTSGLVFGISLEKCIENDRRMGNQAILSIYENQLIVGVASGTSGRSSRNSISSLGDNHRLNSGSCESLATGGLGLHFIGHAYQLQETNSSSSIMATDTSERRDSSHDEYSANAIPSGVTRSLHLQVPNIVVKFTDYLLQEAKRQQREDIDRGVQFDFDGNTKPHDVAALLKEFLRSLPDPLLTRHLYPAFLKTQKIRNRRLQLEALAHLVQLLPVAHRDTLFVLLKFLSTVAQYADDEREVDGSARLIGNKMDSTNLATVFSPNILHCVQPGQLVGDTELEDRQDVVSVVKTLIEHWEDMFVVPPDVMDDLSTVMLDLFPRQLDYLCNRRVDNCSDDMLAMNDTFPSMALGAVSAQHTPSVVASNAANTTLPLAMSTLLMTELPVFQPMTYSTDLFQDGRSNNELSDTGTPSRRVYVRQDFTHGNAASVDVVNGAAKRRERTSKMKYQEPENEQLRRRRRDKSISEQTGNASTGTNYYQTPSMLTLPGQALKQQQSSQIHSTLTPMTSTFVSGMHARSAAHDVTPNVPDSPIRRQQQQQQQQQSMVQQQQQHSSAASGGVISASLQLSVQLPSATADIPQPLNLAADLPDIPYIEDYGSDFGEFGRTGSIRKMSSSHAAQQVMVAPPRLRQQRRLEQQQQQTVTGSLSLSVCPQPPVGNNGDPGNAGIVVNPSSIDLTKGASGSIGLHEPKLTPSISNIGSAVLRSKTADFERMLQLQSVKKSTVDSDVTTTGPTENICRSSSASAAVGSLLSTVKRTGPIYKRTELIASVQSSKK